MGPKVRREPACGWHLFLIKKIAKPGSKRAAMTKLMNSFNGRDNSGNVNEMANAMLLLRAALRLRLRVGVVTVVKLG